MNKEKIKIITNKELKTFMKTKRIWIPLLIESILLCILIPVIFAYVGVHSNLFQTLGTDVQEMIENFALSQTDGIVADRFSSINDTGMQLTFLFITYLVLPLFLMSAIYNSSMIAANSFAGEKERKTLETLLYSPVNMKELFTGKILAAFIPSIVFIYVSFFISGIVVNLITYKSFGFLFFTDPTWIVFMIWLIPIFTLFNILLNLFISSKVKTFIEAQQIGGLFVLPVVGVIIVQVMGLFFISPMMLFIVGTIFLVLDIAMILSFDKYSKRHQLFESQIK